MPSADGESKAKVEWAEATCSAGGASATAEETQARRG